MLPPHDQLAIYNNFKSLINNCRRTKISDQDLIWVYPKDPANLPQDKYRQFYATEGPVKLLVNILELERVINLVPCRCTKNGVRSGPALGMGRAGFSAGNIALPPWTQPQAQQTMIAIQNDTPQQSPPHFAIAPVVSPEAPTQQPAALPACTTLASLGSPSQGKPHDAVSTTLGSPTHAVTTQSELQAIVGTSHKRPAVKKTIDELEKEMNNALVKRQMMKRPAAKKNKCAKTDHDAKDETHEPADTLAAGNETEKKAGTTASHTKAKKKTETGSTKPKAVKKAGAKKRTALGRKPIKWPTLGCGKCRGALGGCTQCRSNDFGGARWQAI